MKKNISGCYLHSLNCKEGDLDPSYGVLKKINAQCKSFEAFFKFDHIINYYQTNNGFFERIRCRLPFTHISEKWVYKDEYKKYNFIYFRKNIIDFSIISFFKKIKRHNPNCKIVFEIPTFPYDKEEFKTIKDLPFKIKDRVNRKKLYKYIDVITTFTSTNKKIFNTPVITIMNGVDVDSIPIKKEFNGDEINIVIMSLFSHWHGFERLIKGLGNYYGNKGLRNIKLHFIGDGIAVSSYKELVDNLHLNNHVVFYGKLSGKDLDNVFEKCNLACDSLGLHRLGLEISSTLKSREYCARGLPIICSSKVDFIGEDFKYFLKLPSNDTDVNIGEIIDFYDNIYSNNDPKIVFAEIRKYAKNKVDMSSTMMPVINYIKENTND